MDSIWNERSRVINISWDNLLRNRPKTNKFKLNDYICQIVNKTTANVTNQAKHGLLGNLLF